MSKEQGVADSSSCLNSTSYNQILGEIRQVTRTKSDEHRKTQRTAPNGYKVQVAYAISNMKIDAFKRHNKRDSASGECCVSKGPP